MCSSIPKMRVCCKVRTNKASSQVHKHDHTTTQKRTSCTRTDPRCRGPRDGPPPYSVIAPGPMRLMVFDRQWVFKPRYFFVALEQIFGSVHPPRRFGGDDSFRFLYVLISVLVQEICKSKVQRGESKKNLPHFNYPRPK